MSDDEFDKIYYLAISLLVCLYLNFIFRKAFVREVPKINSNENLV